MSKPKAAEAGETGGGVNGEEKQECPALPAHSGVGDSGKGGGGEGGGGEEGSGELTPSSDALLAHALLEGEEGMGGAEGISVADLLTPNTSRSAPCPSPFVLRTSLLAPRPSSSPSP